MSSDFQQYHIFCDESSTSDQYTVIGALMMRTDVVERAEQHFTNRVEQHGGSSEIKWTKCKKHNMPLYQQVSSDLFRGISRGFFKYQALVVDNSKMDHHRYNEGDKEIGFNKMLFVLLFSFIRKYRSRPRLHIRLDNRTTVHTPERLQIMLNAKAARDYAITHQPVRTCHFRDSKDLKLIQLTDILAGAIAFQTNRKHIATHAAKHKIDLANHISQLAGLPFLSRPTPNGDFGFDIWHFDFAKARGPRAPRQ